MTTETTRPNPLELWTESVSAWRDLSQSAGEAWMDAMISMKPGSGEAAPEAATRDLFRKLADLNLQHWEHAAKLIEAMEVPVTRKMWLTAGKEEAFVKGATAPGARAQQVKELVKILTGWYTNPPREL